MWQANHDIQYVVSAYACAQYIIGYMMKSQRGLSLTLAQAKKEATSQNKPLKEKMKMVANKFLNTVEISEQEACWNVLQMPMHRSSRATVFVPTARSSERTVLMKSVAELEQLRLQDPKSKDVAIRNVIDRYAVRPRGELDNICLAEFACWYESKQQKKGDKKVKDEFADFDEDDVDFNLEEEDGADKGPRYIRRTKAKVLRYVRFSRENAPEDYYRERILLYVPWRKTQMEVEEEVLLRRWDGKGSFKTFAHKWEALMSDPFCQEKLRQTMPEYDELGDILEEVILEAMRLQTEENDAIVAPVAQHQNEVDEAEAEIDPDIEEHVGEGDIGLDLGDYQPTAMAPAANIKFTKEDLLEGPLSLNTGQRRIFLEVLNRIKTTDLNQKDSQPLRLFISGGAGTGKSYLLRMIRNAINDFYERQMKPADDSPFVLTIAPSGTAAFLVDGRTIHNGLGFTPGKVTADLNNDKRNQLQSQYHNLQVVILDEVSMTGRNMLQNISSRLNTIFGLPDQSNIRFGNRHVLVFGDLYQLEPVKDGTVYGEYKDPLMVNIWEEQFSLFELEEVMRQKDDQAFAHTCNRVRTGTQTKADLELLGTREITEEVAKQLEGKPGLVYFTPENKRVDEINSRVYDSLTEQKVTFEAKDSFPNRFGQKEVERAKARLALLPPNDTGGVYTTLNLAKGMRVEVTSNVDTSDGLVNGAGGMIQHIDVKKSCVWVKFELAKVGEKLCAQNAVLMSSIQKLKAPGDKWVPILRTEIQFFVKNSKTGTFLGLHHIVR